MKSAAQFAVIIAVCTLVACSAPPQQVADQRCDAFARTGGYPLLTGGPTYGPNSSIERLPGKPPLMFGPFEDDVQQHLDEEDYLRSWCLENR